MFSQAFCHSIRPAASEWWSMWFEQIISWAQVYWQTYIAVKKKKSLVRNNAMKGLYNIVKGWIGRNISNGEDKSISRIYVYSCEEKACSPVSFIMEGIQWIWQLIAKGAGSGAPHWAVLLAGWVVSMCRSQISFGEGKSTLLDLCLFSISAP